MHFINCETNTSRCNSSNSLAGLLTIFCYLQVNFCCGKIHCMHLNLTSNFTLEIIQCTDAQPNHSFSQMDRHVAKEFRSMLTSKIHGHSYLVD